MAGKRAFVAVALDDDVRQEMAGLTELLRRTQADVKWVAPENLHMTLKFLGEVSPETEEAVSVALIRSLGTPRAAAFAFTLGGLGAYPSLSRPRVIWVGVQEGQERLASIASQVDQALTQAGFPTEARPFSPHLTLGRCRSATNLNELKRAMEKMHDYEGPRVSVRRVVLYSSVLRPTGPVYEPLSTFELQVGGPQ